MSIDSRTVIDVDYALNMRMTLSDTLIDGAKYAQEHDSGAIVRAECIDLDWLEDASGQRQRAIRWKIRDHPPNWKVVHPPADLAVRFSNLRKARPTEILGFAKKWGTLGICAAHPGLPVNHLNLCLPIRNADPTKAGAYLEGIAEGLEPIRFWWVYARLIHAVLQIGAQLSKAEVGEYGLWRVLFPESPRLAIFDEPDEREKLAVARYRFSQRVAELYRLTGIVNVLDWELQYLSGTGQWIWRARSIRPFNLVSVLAVQTIKVLCGGVATMVCSGCGHEYSRTGKRSKRGQSNYCVECQKDGAPQRAAHRRRTERLQRAREFLLEGRSIDEIAKATECRVSTITNLAKKLGLAQIKGKNGKT